MYRPARLVPTKHRAASDAMEAAEATTAAAAAAAPSADVRVSIAKPGKRFASRRKKCDFGPARVTMGSVGGFHDTSNRDIPLHGSRYRISRSAAPSHRVGIRVIWLNDLPNIATRRTTQIRPHYQVLLGFRGELSSCHVDVRSSSLSNQSCRDGVGRRFQRRRVSAASPSFPTAPSVNARSPRA